MADPLSITGLVIAIGGVVQILVNYGLDAKDARKDIQSLTTELFALKGVLEHIEYQQQAFSSNPTSPKSAKYASREFSRMLESAKELLESLRKSLKPAQSHFGQSVQRMTWPLKKEDVQKQIARIERVKTWLIVVMTTDNLSCNQDILLEVSRLSKTIQDEREQREMERADREGEDLLQWLAPVGPEPAHSKACAAHHHDTSDWFLRGPLKQFLESRPGKGAILWLKGKSGCGKTTLIAHVIEHLKVFFSDAENTGIAYFYCSFDDLASQDPLNILGSLAAQLASQVPQILEGFSSKFAEGLKKKLPRNISLPDLIESFIQHTARLSRIFLSVDAINETEKSTEVVTLLFELANKCKNVSLLISSTGEHGNQRSIETTVLEIEMRAGEVDSDIRLYIDSVLAENDNLKRFGDALKNDIREAVLSRSDGMFRYARWQMEHLAAQRTGRGARKALLDMPQNLNETYKRVLTRLPTDSPDRILVQRTLLWLSFATRPLHLLELSDAVVLEDDDMGLDSDSKLHLPEVLIDLAQGLIDCDRDSMLVSLSHSSIKTFLTSAWILKSSVADFALEESKAHKTIMRKCLTHLSFSEFRNGCGQSALVCETRTNKHPLLAYAAHNWALHVRNVNDEDWQHIRGFFSTRILPNGGNYGWWIQCTVGSLPPRIVQQTSPLYYAASLGYTSLVKAILDFDQSVNLEEPGGRQGSTALQVACFRKQREASRLLVQAGANPFSPDGSPVEGGLSAFFWSKANGWEDIMELMTKSAVACGLQAQQRVYKSGSVAYALTVQKTAVQAMEDASSSGKLIRASFPAYRLEKDVLERFLKERFGPYEFNLKFGLDQYVFDIPASLSEVDVARLRELRM